MNQENAYQEDEIDLKELWNTLVKRKNIILGITLIITLLAIAFALIRTPIYEVKSNIQVGSINNSLIVDSKVLVKTLKVVFNVEDKIEKKEKFISEVSDIKLNKKLKNFIEVKTQAISNEEALKKNKEVLKYAQNKYKYKIDQYVLNIDNQIYALKQSIINLKSLETINLQNQIEKIKTQEIANIDKKIIFYKQEELRSMKKKMQFHIENLKEYKKSVNSLYDSSINQTDKTLSMVSAIQMVNYQNLILNSQNQIEELKLSISQIKNITIPNLRQNIENIKKDKLRNLDYKLNITLPNKEKKLHEQIKQLEYKLSQDNTNNSHVVGDYIVHSYPIKPKKKLIVIVAFITGLILSIFLVFFLEFIGYFKEEVNKTEEL